MSKAVLLSIHPTAKRIIEAGCVPIDDLKKYQGAKGELFAWECRCKMKFSEPRPLSAYGLKRAPQSWQYVEVMDR